MHCLLSDPNWLLLSGIVDKSNQKSNNLLLLNGLVMYNNKYEFLLIVFSYPQNETVTWAPQYIVTQSKKGRVSTNYSLGRVI